MKTQLAPRVELVNSSDSDLTDEEDESNVFLDGEKLLTKPETVEEKVKRRREEEHRKEKNAVSFP